MKQTTEQIEKITSPRKGLFFVERTSGIAPPCHQSRMAITPIVDSRNTDDPKKVPQYRFDDSEWYEKGTNHRVVNGHISRDMGWQCVYVIEIEDVLEFVKEHEECVIRFNSGGYPVIEIYDAPREF